MALRASVAFTISPWNCLPAGSSPCALPGDASAVTDLLARYVSRVRIASPRFGWAKDRDELEKTRNAPKRNRDI
jgi:hypothetical protein